MKNYYLPVTQWTWLVLLWTGLLSQTTWAQSVPDSQFARLGTTLAITTDGGFVTTEIISNPTIGPTRSGSNVIKYSVQGDRRWQTGFLEGGFFIGGRIPGYSYEVIQASLIAPTTDGGVAVVGRTSLRGEEVVTKISATGVPRRWEETDLFKFPDGITFDDLVGTPDGGFLLLATRATYGAQTTVYLRKYNADVSVAWTKEIAYPTPNPATPDRSLTKGETLINTPDGGFLVAGLYIPEYNNTIESLDDLLRQSLTRNTAWVAKLDGQGNVSWQKLLTNLPIAPGPNDLAYNVSVDRMLTATDATLAADGNGYALVGAGYPASTRFTPITRSIVELNTDGSFKRARTILGTTAESFVTLYTGSGGRRYYAVGSRSQNSVNPEISLINPAPLPLTDLDLFKIEARRTFDGPDDGTLLAIGVAGDGGLIFASSGNQVVKLAPETATPPPPTGTLALIQPTYNCQTGAITFNTTGGNGSPITYNAPGVMRSSATSNSGTVEPGLRGDPKPITITATQNGQTVSYTFDFGAFCTGTPPPVTPPVNPPPTPPTPPTGGTLALTQPTYNCQTGAIVFNTTGGDGSPITYNAPGVSRSSATSNSGTVEPGLRGDPKPLVITATQSGQTASYTFDFGAFCTGTPPPVNPPVNPPAPPPGGTLALLAPTYDCVSGAFTFRTSGGNGSSIEYMAVGITGWTSNPNQFVDRDSRTANDVKPFTLMARQNGVVVSYEWDLKVACGRSQARLGVAGERKARLSVSVLGNPVSDAVTVEIRGAESQPLTLRLLDMRGRLVESRFVKQAGAAEQQIFDVAQQGPGLLLLRVGSGTQIQTVKILKQ
ncbi:T9SS type A sorting domain-containing protein [Spirosoma arcticum]